MQNQSARKPAPQQNVLMILWGVMLFSVGLYGAIGYIKLSELLRDEVFSNFPNFDFSNTFILALTVVAGLTLTISFFVPKIFLKPMLKKLGPTQKPDAAEKRRLYLMPFIVRLALIEAVAMYGFIMCNFTGSNAGFALMAVAVLGYLPACPTTENIDAAFEV